MPLEPCFPVIQVSLTDFQQLLILEKQKLGNFSFPTHCTTSIFWTARISCLSFTASLCFFTSFFFLLPYVGFLQVLIYLWRTEETRYKFARVWKFCESNGTSGDWAELHVLEYVCAKQKPGFLSQFGKADSGSPCYTELFAYSWPEVRIKSPRKVIVEV